MAKHLLAANETISRLSVFVRSITLRNLDYSLLYALLSETSIFRIESQISPFFLLIKQYTQYESQTC